MSGITIERNVKSKSRKAKPSTNANTIGARAFIVWLKSCVPAVSPVTASCVPGGSVAITRGITGYVGYNFLYVNKVARPGSQINPVVNTASVPFSPNFGTTRPLTTSGLFAQDDFWNASFGASRTRAELDTPEAALAFFEEGRRRAAGRTSP